MPCVNDDTGRRNVFHLWNAHFDPAFISIWFSLKKELNCGRYEFIFIGSPEVKRLPYSLPWQPVYFYSCMGPLHFHLLIAPYFSPQVTEPRLWAEVITSGKHSCKVGTICDFGGQFGLLGTSGILQVPLTMHLLPCQCSLVTMAIQPIMPP